MCLFSGSRRSKLPYSSVLILVWLLGRVSIVLARMFMCVGSSGILKALLFLCCYCWKFASHIRLSFVLFQVFCSLLWCFLHRRKCCWLRFPLSYVVFNKVCEVALATQAGVMRRSIKVSSFIVLKCTNLIHFRLTAGRVDSAGVHSYVLGCLWTFTVYCNTVGRHGYSFLPTTCNHIQWTISDGNRTDSPDWRHLRESHVTDGEPETVVSASLQKIKSDYKPT